MRVLRQEASVREAGPTHFHKVPAWAQEGLPNTWPPTMVKPDGTVSNACGVVGTRATSTSHLGLPLPSWVSLPWVCSQGILRCIGKREYRNVSGQAFGGIPDAELAGTGLDCCLFSSLAQMAILSSSPKPSHSHLAFHISSEDREGPHSKIPSQVSIKKLVSRVSSPQPRTPVHHSAFILHTLPPVICKYYQ